MLITIVSFIVVFTLLALAHELGHFIWARKAGIRVLEFGFGFGPRLLSVQRGQTTFSLNLIPILAFVRIAGEGDDAEDEACPVEERFYSKSAWARFKTLFAGPAMNILFAFFILAVLFAFSGIPSGLSSEIGAISPGSPAEKSGITIASGNNFEDKSPLFSIRCHPC